MAVTHRIEGDVVAEPEPGVAIVYRVVADDLTHPHEIALVLARGLSNVVSSRVIRALRDSVALHGMRKGEDYIFARAVAVRFRSKATAAVLALELA